MHVFRPIRESDFPAFRQLAFSIKGSLTNLPKDADVLRERIEDSLRAFSARVKRPGGEFYFFVLEDLATGKIVGTSGLLARVGGFEPFYSYEVRTSTITHRPLQIEKPIEVLHLKRQHRGPTEVCSLFLHEDSRRGGIGRLLSLARFLFVSAFRNRFDELLLAEMRGYTDATGRSPFWEAVGRHFFDCDLQRADLLCGLGDKNFIADLMPAHPLYVPLLPADAQAAMGRCHPDTDPAHALLKSEGFVSNREIDIFDGGPLLHARPEDLRIVRARRTSHLVEIIPDVETASALATELLTNGELDFRACLGPVLARDDGIALPASVAAALNLTPGAHVLHAPLRQNAASIPSTQAQHVG